jgi:hypothetical protein
LEKLRTETAECEMIVELATDKAKQELFAKLAEHYKVLASELERAIKQKEAGSAARALISLLGIPLATLGESADPLSVLRGSLKPRMLTM